MADVEITIDIVALHARTIEPLRNIFGGVCFGDSGGPTFLGPLADFIAGKFPEKPNRLPKALPEGIRCLIAGLDAPTLALMALAPLLHRIHAGWQGKDTDSAEMLLKKAIGEEFRARYLLIASRTLSGARSSARRVAPVPRPLRT